MIMNIDINNCLIIMLNYIFYLFDQTIIYVKSEAKRS